ncbi:APC family permease [Oceanobacter mangrovi]|uniref:APC family permease n=1 Tax=Oceanobacter mangrovi TaxID=2862510 RepID=UPI001C8EA368
MKLPIPNPFHNQVHRPRDKALGVAELIAIALGGMVGGGIFTILGISVAMVGVYTPLVIAVGGVIATFAAYSYVKLGVYYRDEGATYSFFCRTFPRSQFAASLIGWWVIFGYISTLALYAYTFASYAISGFAFADSDWVRKAVACGIILVFALINVWSVRGMGKIEDLMVYSKLVILAIISFVLINNSTTTLPVLWQASEGGAEQASLLSMMMLAALTFVAYEGFQLVINAVNEMERPERNIPLAIYSAMGLATLIYVVIALGAILAIPFDDIIQNQEYALAAGAGKVLGHWGTELVIVGALLATSSAISGTVFGASRQMAVIARDGYFPALLAHRNNRIPTFAILAMAFLAMALVVSGGLVVILEFASFTFLLVSILMAWANFRLRDKTASSTSVTLISLAVLVMGLVLIIVYEASHQPEQLYFIFGLYLLLTLGAWFYAARKQRQTGATR